jgi:tetratricopeptide (TPR) repeat protein
VATSPNADEACPQMGEAYRLAGQLAKAIDAHERCLAFDPRNPDLLFHAAHAQEWKDDWTRARALYTEAAAIDPKNMDVQIGLGRVALHANDLTRARALIRPVLQRGENADALLLAGLIANRADDLNAARDYFTRGIAASPAYTDLHFYLGQLEERAGHIAAARTAYQRARVLDPARDDVQRALDRLGAAK